jgi:hypothetical protein
MARIAAGRPSGVPNPSQHGNGEVEGDIELDGEGAPGAESPHVGGAAPSRSRGQHPPNLWEGPGTQPVSPGQT